MEPVHAILMENIAKEELLLHGYCKDDNYTLPLITMQMNPYYL